MTPGSRTTTDTAASADPAGSADPGGMSGPAGADGQAGASGPAAAAGAADPAAADGAADSAGTLRRVLAGNLRALRTVRGSTLSELARRSGIAKATLSQLEAGAGNPTIETLFSLSKALDVPVSELVSDQAPTVVALVRAHEGTHIAGDAVRLRLLHRLPAGGAVLEVYEQQVLPDAVQHSRGHPGLEHIHVVSGVLRVGPPEAPHRLGPGDYVCFRADTPHCYQAVGGPVMSTLVLQYPAGTIDAPHGKF